MPHPAIAPGLVALFVLPAAGQDASYMEFAPLEPGSLGVVPLAVSRDGSIVGGYGWVPGWQDSSGKCYDPCTPTSDQRGVIWNPAVTEALGVSELLPCCEYEPRQARVDALSPLATAAGGESFGAWFEPHQAAVWLGGSSEPILLGYLSSSYGARITAVTDGAAVAVGRGYDGSEYRAVVSVGMLPITELPAGLEPGDESWAVAVTDDGSTIVGSIYKPVSGEPSYPRGVRWNRVGGSWAMEGLFDGYLGSTVTDVTPDGAYVLADIFVDASTTAVAIQGPDGAVVVLPDTHHMDGMAISDDGAVIVAEGPEVEGGPSNVALMWDAAHGWRSIAQVLADLGVPAPATLTVTNREIDVSGDGQTIVGGEGWKAFIPRSPLDSDGDGLLDDWERNGGIPYGDGFRLELPGADWQRKDLYVEIDVMQDMVTPALDDVVAAFDARGITLHAVYDETNLPHFPIMSGPGLMPDEFVAARATHFGPPGDHGDTDKLEARAKAWRYCLFGDRLEREDAEGQSFFIQGLAEGIWSNNFIVAAGECMTNENLCYHCDPASRFVLVRSVFMHELGHCLELTHGGGQGPEFTGWRPNYMSVMNYAFSLPFKLSHQTWALDFSSGVMPGLLESDLDEAAGLAHPAYNGRITYHAINPCLPGDCSGGEVGATPLEQLTIGSGAHDFDDDGAIDAAGVCADLNYYGTPSVFRGGDSPTPCGFLEDFDDWSNLRLEVRPAGVPLPGLPIEELSVEQVAGIMALLPAPCRADVAPDFGDGVVDVQDLLLLLSNWGACTDCPADIEPPLAADRVVDVQDLLSLLSKWGECG